MHDQCWYVLPAFGNRRVDAATAKNRHNRLANPWTVWARLANRSLAVLLPMMKREERLGLLWPKTGFETNYLTDHE